MIHEELSGKIIGAGMEVLNELKPGAGSKTNAILVLSRPLRGQSRATAPGRGGACGPP